MRTSIFFILLSSLLFSLNTFSAGKEPKAMCFLSYYSEMPEENERGELIQEPIQSKYIEISSNKETLAKTKSVGEADINLSLEPICTTSRRCDGIFRVGLKIKNQEGLILNISKNFDTEKISSPDLLSGDYSLLKVGAGYLSYACQIRLY